MWNVTAISCDNGHSSHDNATTRINIYRKKLVNIVNNSTKYIHIFVAVKPALLCYSCVELQPNTQATFSCVTTHSSSNCWETFLLLSH